MPPTIRNRSEFLYRIILLASLLTMVVVSIRSLRPPSQDNDRFSTEAALTHLRFIASEPHPVGLPHHKAVREYLTSEFARLGYAVQTQEAMSAIPLCNVLARRPGLVPGNKAIMLAAHYDSVRWGPGAGDDSAAVAALLEVARNMSTGFYRNDIIFLITDGEEMGMWGAKLFVDKHPWSDEVGVVLNFDARGTSGPSVMYETSDDNAWLINQFSEVDPHPVCGSMTQEVYRWMPNKTDFTIFRRKIQGLNFAFIGSYTNYHTENDDVAHLDVASMRHHGIQALALAERFAQQNLTDIPRGGDDVYFDLLSRFVVRYSADWAPVIAGAVAVIVLGAITIAFRMKLISATGMLYSTGLFCANLGVVFVLCWAILWITRNVNLDQRAEWAIAAFVMLTCAITVAVFCSVSRLSSLELAATGLVVWTILTLLTGFIARGFSHLTAWPLFFSGIGFACSLLSRGRLSAWNTMVLLLAALPAGVLMPRIVYLTSLGLKVGKAPSLMILVVLLMWLVPLQVRPGPALLPQPPDAA